MKTEFLHPTHGLCTTELELASLYRESYHAKTITGVEFECDLFLIIDGGRDTTKAGEDIARAMRFML